MFVEGHSVDFRGGFWVWGHCRQPPHCVPETYTNATSWYKVFTTVRDSETKYSQDYNPFWCYKGAIGKVYHTLNPKLTVIVPDVSCLSRTDASDHFLIWLYCSSHKLLVSTLKPVSFSLQRDCRRPSVLPLNLSAQHFNKFSQANAQFVWLTGNCGFHTELC